MKADENVRDNNVVGKFTSWVDIVARRTRYNYIKRESKYTFHVCLYDLHESELRIEDVELTRSHFNESGQFEFESEWLMNAFAKLSSKHKRILELLYVEEKTPQEVADIIGCTVRNIYNQQYNAFKIIRDLKKEEQSDEENI